MSYPAASYESFADLSRAQAEGIDYRVVLRRNAASRVAVIAPHGGGIELHSSEVASAIAGADFNFYSFEGLRAEENFHRLHLTSHKFDEPRCLQLLADCDHVVALHGCRGDLRQVLLGGRDDELKQRLAAAIAAAGIEVAGPGHRYPALNPGNICNRGRRCAGVQIEMTTALRFQGDHSGLATAIRSVLLELDA